MAATEASVLATINEITALATMINNIRPPVRTPVFDPFQEDVPFDLSTRAASQTYIDISAPLQDEWDGNVATFPSFIVSLQMRDAEGKWNQAVPHGILTINGRNGLTDYHSVTDAEITTAYANRTDTRSIQSSTAMFKYIKQSVMEQKRR